jgi:hypothetical protein
VTTLSSLMLLVYAVVNAFAAWAVIRRRSDTAKGFMGAAALLVVAAVAVAFGHWAKVPFAVAGVLLASWVSYLDARHARVNVETWRHALRAGAGALVVAAVLAAPTGAP